MRLPGVTRDRMKRPLRKFLERLDAGQPRAVTVPFPVQIGQFGHGPCYIPSHRTYAEGGYQGDSSMDGDGWPTRLAAGTEDRIIATVRPLVPNAFAKKEQP